MSHHVGLSARHSLTRGCKFLPCSAQLLPLSADLMQPTEPLVPILRVEDGLADRTALATWHEALSDALAADIPHDLLGLWLYTVAGEAVLLGPEALAQDSLDVPLPSPQLQQYQLDALASTIRRAGYGSVICLPVRFGRRDVGLVLLADLRPDRYGEGELVTLRLVTQRLSPALGRLARQWPGERGAQVPQVERMTTLLDSLSRADGSAATPQRFLAVLGPALEPLIPHDHLELLLSDPAGSRYYRLGEHAGGALWLDPSLTIGREYLDLDTLFGGADTLVLPDACRDSRWPRGYFTVAEPAGAEPRAVVGARVKGPRGMTAFLLAASVGADLYEEADAALLARVASLVTPQIALLVATAGNGAPEPDAGEEQAALLARVASLLATATLVDATRRIRDLAAGVLPFDDMSFAVRLSEGSRIVKVEPGESRSIPDMPLVSVGGTLLDQVLRGELPGAFDADEGETRLIAPLRVAGLVHGALVLAARNPALLVEAHLASAQQLADVLAPHLELLRRTALLPQPFRPGWKRTQRQ